MMTVCRLSSNKMSVHSIFGAKCPTLSYNLSVRFTSEKYILISEPATKNVFRVAGYSAVN